MEGQFNFNDVILDALKKLGRANILLAGKTGVGKSTLINAVFNENLAETGVGNPVTHNIRAYTKEGLPLCLYDTRGLELKNFDEISNEIVNLVNQKRTDDPKDHIVLAWYCINNSAPRIEPGEIDFIKKLSSCGLKVIIVFTQTTTKDKSFFKSVKDILYQEPVQFIQVLAQPYESMAGTINQFGLDSLINMSLDLLPDAQKNAFAAAQKVNIEAKEKRAQIAVASAAGIAAGAGAVPIPFSDAAILAPTQIGMLASISAIMGLNLNKAFLATLVSSAAGISGATFLGKTIVSNLIKLIPGAGSVIGGTISATTAAAITTAMGEAYIAALKKLITNSSSLDPDSVAEAFKSELKKK